MSNNPLGMKTGWWSFELPRYRPHPRRSTYSLFSYEDLPPISEKLDDNFEWLWSQPIKKRSLLEGCASDGSTPDLSKLAEIAAEIPVRLPSPFTVFMDSTKLHHRIRSCTDCYLELPEYVVETKGRIEGYLIHFLSDSQWVGHWYIHVDHDGHHFVVTSRNAYGFLCGDEYGSMGAKKIDLEVEDIWLCAPSFTEFIYRFWLENEIWYSLTLDKRPLTQIEQVYVDGYSAEANSHPA